VQITNLKLKNYRNYESLDVTFSADTTAIIGKNAQGKTNMLEAIYFVSIGKSLRVANDKDLILHDKDIAKILANIKTIHGTKKIEIVLSKKTKKGIKINERQASKVSELLGEFTCVYFSPDELRLIKDEPANRRRFLDVLISQLDKIYFNALVRYEKTLAHRNKLLRTARTLEECEDSLDVFTEQLVESASIILLERYKFIKKLEPHIKTSHTYLAGDEECSIEYLGPIKMNVGVVVPNDPHGSQRSATPTASRTQILEKLKQELLSEFNRNKKRDFEKRHTSIGVHRDDIKCMLNGKDIKVFGSQGQQRTATLSLKLAECEIFKEKTGAYPVLLLDDVLSELDADRQQKLLEYSKKMQTIITGTYLPKNLATVKVIKIENGKIL